MEPASKGTVGALTSQNPQMLSFLPEGDEETLLYQLHGFSDALIICIYRWLSGQHPRVFENKSSTNKKTNNPEIRTAWGSNPSKIDEYHLSSPSASI